MGGGGDIRVFTDVTGPAIAQKLRDAGVDAVLFTCG
jgi:D-proline reductase (dithiol) PrdB